MAQRSSGNVRMGIVSFITLVSVVLLAVLSVLCIVTANATDATAQRQATSTRAQYALDSAAQRCLSAVDGYLAQGTSAGESASQAVARVLADADGTLSAAGNTTDGITLSSTTQASDNTFELVFSHTDGRTLQVVLSISDDLAYSIDAWQTATVKTDSADALWSGSNGQASSTDTALQSSSNE